MLYSTTSYGNDACVGSATHTYKSNKKGSRAVGGGGGSTVRLISNTYYFICRARRRGANNLSCWSMSSLSFVLDKRAFVIITMGISHDHLSRYYCEQTERRGMNYAYGIKVVFKGNTFRAATAQYVTFDLFIPT